MYARLNCTDCKERLTKQFLEVVMHASVCIAISSHMPSCDYNDFYTIRLQVYCKFLVEISSKLYYTDYKTGVTIPS